MDADNLYKESQGQLVGMSHRSLILAIRYDLADWKNGIKIQKMLAMIESGDVWSLRGVGKRTVREWCKFIADTTNGISGYRLDADSRTGDQLKDVSPSRELPVQLTHMLGVRSE